MTRRRKRGSIISVFDGFKRILFGRHPQGAGSQGWPTKRRRRGHRHGYTVRRRR
jgi:hypothetical protein